MKINKKDIEKMKQAHQYLLNAQNGSSKQSRFEKAVEKSIKILQKLQPKVVITQNEEAKESAATSTATDNDIEMKSKDNKESNDNNNNNDKNKEKIKEEEPPKPQKPKVREAFTQTAANITFTLYIKNLTQDDVDINFDTKRVLIKLKLKDGTTYIRNLELSGNIDPEKSSFTMNKYKVNVKLIKKTVGNWDKYENEMDDGKKKPAVSTPWNSKRDWVAVDKYAAEELEKEKPEGDEALQSLFGKIYKDADDDQRRAMVKSFQTSGGTVLSTNWGDVKDKDYEGKDKVLPTGQNVEKWEY